MKFCSQCAGEVRQQLVENDEIPRYVCTGCQTIHYQNPKLVVGTLPVYNGKILLTLRNIEPASGLWTLPAGYLELNETVTEGAIRETYEETGAEVTGLQPYCLYDIVHIGQIYLIFLAQLTSPKYHPTAESLDVRLFTLNEIPWQDIAFPVIESVLRKYQNDSKEGVYQLYLGKIDERMKSHKHGAPS